MILKHALRNSLIPIVTLVAGLLPHMIGGSVMDDSAAKYAGADAYGSWLRRTLAPANSTLLVVGAVTIHLFGPEVFLSASNYRFEAGRTVGGQENAESDIIVGDECIFFCFIRVLLPRIHHEAAAARRE